MRFVMSVTLILVSCVFHSCGTPELDSSVIASTPATGDCEGKWEPFSEVYRALYGSMSLQASTVQFERFTRGPIPFNEIQRRNADILVKLSVAIDDGQYIRFRRVKDEGSDDEFLEVTVFKALGDAMNAWHGKSQASACWGVYTRMAPFTREERWSRDMKQGAER